MFIRGARPKNKDSKMTRGLLVRFVFFVAGTVALGTVYLCWWYTDLTRTDTVTETVYTTHNGILRHVSSAVDTSRSPLRTFHSKQSLSRDSNHERAIITYISPSTSASSTPANLGLHGTTVPPLLFKEKGGSTPNSSRGHLLAVRYDQQLQAGFHGYCQLAEITGLLNLTAVEPFVLRTNLMGAPPVGSLVLKLGDLYNMDYLKGALKSYHGLEHLVSFDTFAERASRHAVLVFFLTDLKFFTTYFSGKDKIVEISPDIFNVYVRNLVKALNRWTLTQRDGVRTPFVISRIVFMDVRPYHPLPLASITEKLQSITHEQVERYGSVTIILERWRGIHNISDSKFFYFIPGFITHKPLRTLPYSQVVLAAAHGFAQTLGATKPVVGVHIRGERLLLDYKGNITLYLRCLQELKQYITNRTTQVSDEQIHVFHDLGTYGTMSCTLKNCVQGRSQFVKNVKKLGFPIVSFDPATFNSVPDNHALARSPAFASLVELEYLSRVNELVTVGRGGFQQALVERFLEHSGGTSGKVHRICSDRPPRPVKPS